MNPPIPLTEALNNLSSRARAHATPKITSTARVLVGNETQSQQVIESLRSDPLLAAKVTVAIEAALNATRSVWSKEAETFIEVPDYKTQLAAAELYLHNTVGLPVQRTENFHINKNVPSDGRNHPPAAIAEMKRIVAKADAEMAKRTGGTA